MRCPVCDADRLVPVAGSETSVVCGSCESTLSRCIYCSQTTFRLLGDVCACVNPSCIAKGVPWRRCADCERFGIPLVSEGSDVCIDNSHTLVDCVRCFACDHEYPRAIGGCIHRGCPAALQRVETCPHCKKRARSAKTGQCLDGGCVSRLAAAATLPEPPPATAAPQDPHVERLFKSSEERYELEKRLFEGGMGEIWQAHDRLLGRRVALKIARRDVAEISAARGQFLKEARIGARLHHPNVLPVFDVGIDREKRVYFTMRFVEGASLGHTVDSIATGCATNFVDFPLRKVVGAFARACQGVSFAHEHGVIHLDLKPDNILISGFNEVFVIDWGIARVDGEDDSKRLLEIYGGRATDPKKDPTSTLVGHPDTGKSGPVVGTPGYMAPEQFQGEPEKFGPATDVFGLGGILFHALYGAPPCRPKEDSSILEALQATVEPQKPGKLRPGIVPRGERVKTELLEGIAGLERIALRCLERDIDRRYSSVEELVIDVNEWLQATRVLEPDSRAVVG